MPDMGEMAGSAIIDGAAALDADSELTPEIGDRRN
jgi:hypothetical protein